MKPIRTIFIASALCLAACAETGNTDISLVSKELYLQAGVDDSRAIGALCEGFSFVLEQTIASDSSRYAAQGISVDKYYTGEFFVIHFEFSGLCSDGVVRSGNITAKATKDNLPWQADSRVELKYANYLTNGATFTGTQYLTVTQAYYTDTLPRAATSIACASSVKNASLVEELNKDKYLSLWSSEQAWEWTPRQIFIAGSGGGSTSSGFSYSYLIKKDLLKPSGCKYISEGVEEMLSRQDTATINYDTFGGEDECDRFLFISFQGNTTEERLPY